MKSIIRNILLSGILFLAVIACSETKDDISAPIEPEGIHEEGFANRNSENFHGILLKNMDFNTEGCKTCHASDFSGGTTDVNCNSCHLIHPKDYVSGHIAHLTNNGYNLNQCKTCHQPDYSGGNTDVSCFKCHKEEGGPEACNTCHFYYDPVKDKVYEHGSETHKVHLVTNGYYKPAECSDCHVPTTDFAQASHIDGDNMPEIIFSGLALTETNESTTDNYDSNRDKIIPNPQFNHETKTCSNVYCHGAFKNGNINNTVTWDTEIKCGSCHGDEATGNPLPGGTHFQGFTIEQCGTCHPKEGFDKTHINGKLNVFGQEKDF